MSRVQELLDANAEFAKTWTKPPMMAQMRQRPGEGVFVLTCMDPRVVPEQFLGPEPRVAVFRNAGGRHNRDAVRSLTVFRSLRVNSPEGHLMIVHHTDCGMLHLTNEGIRADILKRNPNQTDPMSEFGVIGGGDLEKTLKEDVAAFKAEPLLHGMHIKGYIMETETGLLREI